MSRPTVTYPRAQNVVVDFLLDEGVSAAARLPRSWTKASSPIVVVGVDGTWSQALSPVALVPTVRLVAWSDSPTRSHDLVMGAAGLMEAHDGELFTARLTSTPIDAVDPEHADAELCAVTLRCRIRSVPLIASA